MPETDLLSLSPGLQSDALAEVWDYAVAGPSKQTRSSVLVAAEVAARGGAGVPDSRIPLAAAAVEMFHLASLPHDDVIDDSEFRRGVVSLPARYGAPTAAAAGGLFFGRALALFARCGSDAVAIAVRTAERMCAGQMLELRDRHDTSRTPARCLEAIEGKTAGMFALAAEVGAILAGANAEIQGCLARYGLALGVGFQIIDDILDIAADQAQMGKPRGNDLQNGNYTLPVIYALEESSEFGDLLRAGAPSQDMVDRVAESSALARAGADARRWIDDAKDAARRLHEHRGLVKIADTELERLWSVAA